MFFDTRLWQFTRGVRLRTAAVVAMGGASFVGIGRLALLGWIEHARAMIAHRTAAQVQRVLRQRLYNEVVALGPSHFGLAGTGAVLLSIGGRGRADRDVLHDRSVDVAGGEVDGNIVCGEVSQ